MKEVIGPTPETGWDDVVELYARELQLSASGEDEGYGLTTIDFVEHRVFESEPAAAVDIYARLANSSEAALRAKAFEKLPQLMKIDERLAMDVYSRLLIDEEVSVLLNRRNQTE